ncbi:MAG: RNA pyrophosphohydrolase [Gammaproteobacteria bacterium]|nr:RNA pyrophosphohydrolase [Gammaproteobacteria bacterium]
MKFSSSQIDSDGFRANVGIVLSNASGQLFWGRRTGMDAWQFPQGGIRPRETVTGAMYRELLEEVGLSSEDVQVLGNTRDWLRYRLPRRYVRRSRRPVCIGQKQIWFLLRLLAEDSKVRLDVSVRPEFDHWRWVDFWEPAQQVVEFKREVYVKALDELAPLLLPAGNPAARTGPAAG